MIVFLSAAVRRFFHFFVKSSLINGLFLPTLAVRVLVFASDLAAQIVYDMIHRSFVLLLRNNLSSPGIDAAKLIYVCIAHLKELSGSLL